MAGRPPLLAGDKLNLEKVSCLLVDDSQQCLDILGTVCTGFGLRNFTKCQTVEEAKAALTSTAFDLMLTDANMPRESGYQLIEWLRRYGSEANRYIPVIIVTGHTRVSQIAKARDCGAHYTVAKPIVPKTILERIFWVARDERAFIECDSYVGPDRRFKREGPPPGIKGRRSDDLPEDVGEPTQPNMSQDEINALMKPSKVSL
jgi:CheY-like chemotaxis protein